VGSSSLRLPVRSGHRLCLTDVAPCVLVEVTDVSDVLATSIIRAMMVDPGVCFKDGHRANVRNVVTFRNLNLKNGRWIMGRYYALIIRVHC
jgi:hypothetical protein